MGESILCLGFLTPKIEWPCYVMGTGCGISIMIGGLFVIGVGLATSWFVFFGLGVHACRGSRLLSSVAKTGVLVTRMRDKPISGIYAGHYRDRFCHALDLNPEPYALNPNLNPRP